MKILPLIILGIFSCVGLGISIGKHGEPRNDYNGWTQFFGLLIDWGLILWAVL